MHFYDLAIHDVSHETLYVIIITHYTIKYDNNFPSPLPVESNANPVIIDFWSYNQGTTVYAKYRGQYT